MADKKLGRTAAIVACTVLALVAANMTASASNMAFKLNKQICQQGTAPVGQNLVALPDHSPYEGAGGLNALCTALGLSSTAQITQWNGTGNVFIHVCTQAQQFNLLAGKGMMIQEPTGTKSGVIVGSDIPNGQIRIENLAVAPNGTNVIPIKYHTTAVTPQDFCVDCGLSNTATVSRFDACTGNVLTHTCGTVAQWSLVLGEAVLILENQGPKVCTPSHF
ncbi:MAG: hypothetical protein HY049_01685 [Acidobacteria bacterium]|nr:hypothetical protein [Acidobacteriota bacterium]